jgi:phosphoribosylanthranilate isomerase
MKKVLIQIYEIQTPDEAATMLALGVDHIGSVLLSNENWKSRSIKDTINTVHEYGAQSSLITLFNDQNTVFRVLDYYRPDMVHFCEALVMPKGMQSYNCNSDLIKNLIDLQVNIRDKFPQIKIIRSIPIAPTGFAKRIPSLKLAEFFEPVSDFFLTDTFLILDKNIKEQPVEGFVGITGKTCDWGMASRLVENSRIPVILAGGISPENVFEGIFKVRPVGVDSCTLTNKINNNGAIVRFKKDPEKVKRLVLAVRGAEKKMENTVQN